MSERILDGLSPERVFYYFEEISRIPRASYHEKDISDYLVSFANEHGLSCKQDEAFNVIIEKPAAKGYEDVPPIILQGHMDMVCEKTKDCSKDMLKEGLDLFIDGDLLGAKGTTLGGDDGIAIAYSLAILEDESIEAPALTFICTTSEETGMGGATAIELSSVLGRRLINIDSEKEGELVCGCAGGARLSIQLPVSREKNEGEYRRISIGGLLGGHSGTEIDKGRANANILMARVLRHILLSESVWLCTFSGGEKDNAIPSSASAVLLIPKDAVGRVEALVEEESAKIRTEFNAADPDISITLESVEHDTIKKECLSPLSSEDTRKICMLLLSLPGGVVRMSSHIEGLVETSLNLGILILKDNELMLTYSLRSSVEAALEALQENMRFMAEGYGANSEVTGEYPAWEYVPGSPLQKKLSEVFQKQTGKSAKVLTIHAGLECGILSSKLDGLDAVSIGPDLYDIHTPNERLSISSTKRVYDLILEVLKSKDW